MMNQEPNDEKALAKTINSLIFWFDDGSWMVGWLSLCIQKSIMAYFCWMKIIIYRGTKSPLKVQFG